ncbi:hypothetical protein DMC47_25180 [Nostoc sp. 3335mG]|nr:hypothetical protein DMC47_25180 [Nostoc sp. 3335mG]
MPKRRRPNERRAVTHQVTGWKLDPAGRAALLGRVQPRYERLVADHVTLRFATDEDTPLPVETEGEVIGVADDDAGVQALVVRIAGTTERGDGSQFHITWSLGPDRKAKESNDVIAARGWTAIEAMRIGLIPARWDR